MKKHRKGYIFLGTGVLCLAAALFFLIYNRYEADRADRAAQAVVSELIHQISESVDTIDDSEIGTADTSSTESPDDREMPTIEIDGYRYIGYLTVPSLDLTLPVMEEWDYDRLKIAPCCYSGTVYKNNLVIAGHNYRRHFSRLRYAGIGTVISFTDVEGNTYECEISDIEILNPDQIDDMTADSESWDLTLFTCTIGGQTRHTIRCSRIDQK